MNPSIPGFFAFAKFYGAVFREIGDERDQRCACAAEVRESGGAC